MKTILLGFLFCAQGFAATYYVSNSGSDSNSGLATNLAWQTVSKVNGSAFSAGDSILFARGELWRETLTAPSSGVTNNPITFSAYGSGANPVFVGANLFTNTWLAYTNGWQTALTPSANSQFTDGAAVNYRNIIPSNQSPVSGTQIRITVKSSSSGGGGSISQTTIGPMTTGFVFDSTPTNITWNSGSVYVAVSQGATQISDNITFPFTASQRYGIHVYSTNRNFVLTTSGGPGMYNTGSTTNQSLTLTPGSGALSATDTAFLIKLEVFDASNSVWYQALSADPILVWGNKTAFVPTNTLSATIATLNSDFFDGTNLFLHTPDNSNPNSNGVSYEYGSRSETFVDNGKSWLVLDGIDQTQSAGSTATLGGVKLTGSRGIYQNFSTWNHYRHCITFYTGATWNTASNVLAYTSHETTPLVFYGPGTVNNVFENGVCHNELSVLRDGALRAHGGSSNNTAQACDFYGNYNINGLMDVFDLGTAVNMIGNTFHGVSTAGGIHLFGTAHGSVIVSNRFDMTQFTSTTTNRGAVWCDGSYGNTISCNSINGNAGVPAVSLLNASTNNTVSHNVISGTAVAFLVDSSATNGSTFDYNLVTTVKTNFGTYTGTTYYTLPTWKAGTGQSSHSFNGFLLGVRTILQP